MEQHDFSPDEDADGYDAATEEGEETCEVSGAHPDEQLSAAQLERRRFADGRTRDMGAEEYGRFFHAREHSSLVVPPFARWVEHTLGMACTGGKGPCEVRMRPQPTRALIRYCT